MLPRRLAFTTILATLALAMLLPSGAAVAQTLSGSIRGADRDRPTIAVKLERLTAGGKPISAGRVTDLGFLPMDGPQVLVTAKHKAGKLLAWDLDSGAQIELLTVPRLAKAGMEQGIVSFAFHPSFPDDRRLYTMHDAKGGPGGQSNLIEWTVEGKGFPDLQGIDPRVLIVLPQPEGGHNAGQVRFGPDGMLYQSFGDGGFQRDPSRRGQITSELYSTIIRIDVNSKSDGLGYGIPPDNPFVGVDGFRPEIWAYGFRNPWRFTWAPDGRLVEADVGQERYEEINIVQPGGNYGWSLREGAGCLTVTKRRVRECEAACAAGDKTMLEPIHHYSRGEGVSIIGGVVATGSAVPALAGKFLFGDYGSSRFWALDLPDPEVPLHIGCGDSKPPPASVHALGRFGVVPISFGITPDGDVLVGGGYGKIWKIVQ